MSAANALLRSIALAVCAVTLPCGAEEVVSGRSKAAQIPNDELNVIVDLTQENGTWIGSIVIPGLE
jgi:hypothetical protein